MLCVGKTKIEVTIRKSGLCIKIKSNFFLLLKIDLTYEHNFISRIAQSATKGKVNIEVIFECYLSRVIATST